MKSVYKSLEVIDPQSPFHGKTVDIVVENGILTDIGVNLGLEGKSFEGKAYIAPGFFDLHEHFGEPGFETNETLESGAKAALKGGITGVTTAYALAKRGFSVTLFERHRYAAMETSFANGGQLSASNAEVWTHWSTILKGMKWMLKNDAPLS